MAALLAGPVPVAVAVARPKPEVAVPARAAAPTRLAERRTDWARRAAERRSLAADRRWRRTDSAPRASPLDSAAARQVRRRAAEAALPIVELVLAVPRPEAAGNRPIAVGAAAAAEVARSALGVAVRPTAVGVVAAAQAPRVHPIAVGQELVPGLERLEPVPPHRAVPPRGARRRRDRTCWWAGWWRRTACRRS